MRSDKYCGTCRHGRDVGAGTPRWHCEIERADECDVLYKLWEPKEDDNVNHPKHYTSHPSGVECIDISKHYNFCIGNAIKYLWRCGLKEGNTAIQDLKKAVWYINKQIEEMEK